MNAKDGSKKKDELFNDDQYIAEQKFDGYRAICDNGKFISRLGNEFTDKVPHLAFLKGLNAVFDGELYLPNQTSSTVTKILGSKTERAIEQQSSLGKLRYVVFDILSVNNCDLTNWSFYERRNSLQTYSHFTRHNKYFELSKTYRNKQELLDTVLKQGGEGIMLKNLNSFYQCDKRPENTWYKIKKHITYDVVCIGFTEGKGKYEGLIGAIEFGLYLNSELIYAGSCSGLTDSMRKELTLHGQDYIGRVLEIGAMQRTDEGFFRHPVFKLWKIDKQGQQCLWNEC